MASNDVDDDINNSNNPANKKGGGTSMDPPPAPLQPDPLKIARTTSPPLDLVTLSPYEQARVLAFVSLNSLLMLAHASSTYADIVREVSERGC